MFKENGWIGRSLKPLFLWVIFLSYIPCVIYGADTREDIQKEKQERPFSFEEWREGLLTRNPNNDNWLFGALKRIFSPPNHKPWTTELYERFDSLNITDLSFRYLGIKGTRALAEALPHSRVTTLDMCNNNLGDEGVTILTAALAGLQVTELNLSSNKVMAEGIKSLAAILPGSNIINLDLAYNDISSDGIRDLGLLLPHTKITYLNLLRNNIGPEGVGFIASGLPASQITRLSLHSNNLGDEGIKMLSVGLVGSQVEYLDLRSNNIGDEGMRAFASALPNSKIVTLYLNNNRIGDEGAGFIAASLSRSQVTKLWLPYNAIGVKGIKSLANVLPISKIESLELAGNNLIGDEGAQILAGILSQSVINHVGLSHTGTGMAGAKALLQILPRSHVTQLRLVKKDFESDIEEILDDVWEQLQNAKNINGKSINCTRKISGEW